MFLYRVVENDNYIKIREIPEISQDNFEKIKYPRIIEECCF